MSVRGRANSELCFKDITAKYSEDNYIIVELPLIFITSRLGLWLGKRCFFFFFEGGGGEEPKLITQSYQMTILVM